MRVLDDVLDFSPVYEVSVTDILKKKRQKQVRHKYDWQTEHWESHVSINKQYYLKLFTAMQKYGIVLAHVCYGLHCQFMYQHTHITQLFFYLC